MPDVAEYEPRGLLSGEVASNRVEMAIVSSNVLSRTGKLKGGAHQTEAQQRFVPTLLFRSVDRLLPCPPRKPFNCTGTVKRVI